MKIIFLDIDGCIGPVSDAEWDNFDLMARRLGRGKWGTVCYPSHTQWVNRITKKTGAKIVISSDWKHQCSLFELAKKLRLGGLTGEIIGATENISARKISSSGRRREAEILRFLQTHRREIKSAVILDDMEISDARLRPIFVRSRPVGKQEYLAAVAVLNGRGS